MSPRGHVPGAGEGHRTREEAASGGIDPGRALDALRGRGVAHRCVTRLEVHPSLPSTNAAALADGRKGLVLVALEQTQGRGRSGASWSSPPGGLYLSFVLPPDLTPSRPTDATLLTGLAVADAVDAAMRPLARRPRTVLKWPNDVLIDGAKVAGVLVQTRGASGEPPDASTTVIGVGINVNTPVRLPGGEDESGDVMTLRPTHLAGAVGRTVELEALLVDVVAELVGRLGTGLAHPTVGEYRQRCATIGERITFTEGGARVEALAVDVDLDGALVIEVDGSRRRLTAGEVRHLRWRTGG